MVDIGKTAQLKHKFRYNSQSIHNWQLSERILREVDRIWCKVGRISSQFSAFGNEGKQDDSVIRETVGLKTEPAFGSIYIELSDTASGAIPHSLESLNDLNRKMKVKNIQAVHEFPRKPTILQSIEERSQVILK